MLTSDLRWRKHHRYCSTPAAAAVQSQNCCRARKGMCISTSILQITHIGSLSVTTETRQGLGDFWKANTGGTDRIGIDCKRHRGLPTVVSCRATTMSSPGVTWLVGCRICLPSERPVDSRHPVPCHLPCLPHCTLPPQRYGELLHLRISLTASCHAAHPAPKSGWIWFKFKCCGSLSIANDLALDLISCASGFGRYGAQRCRRQLAALSKSKTCFDEMKKLQWCKRARHVHLLPQLPRSAHIPCICILYTVLRYLGIAPGLGYMCD